MQHKVLQTSLFKASQQADCGWVWRCTLIVLEHQWDISDGLLLCWQIRRLLFSLALHCRLLSTCWSDAFTSYKWTWIIRFCAFIVVAVWRKYSDMSLEQKEAVIPHCKVNVLHSKPLLGKGISNNIKNKTHSAERSSLSVFLISFFFLDCCLLLLNVSVVALI